MDLPAQCSQDVVPEFVLGLRAKKTHIRGPYRVGETEMSRYSLHFRRDEATPREADSALSNLSRASPFSPFLLFFQFFLEVIRIFKMEASKFVLGNLQKHFYPLWGNLCLVIYENIFTPNFGVKICSIF